MPDFPSLRASALRKAPEIRGFLQETGDRRIGRSAWLGREDSNLRMAESKSAALPLGDAPIACGGRPPRAADHSGRTFPPQPRLNATRVQSFLRATSSIRCVMPFVRIRLARGRVGRMFSLRLRRFVRVQMPSAVSSAFLSERSAYLRK
jgi:hypothetical protein